MVRQCRVIPHQKGVFCMSYSEHWCREFLTRHPEYERQPQVLQQEPVAPSPSSLAAPFPWPSIANTAPPTPSNFVLPLSGFHTAKSGSSEQFPQQGPKTRHDAMQDQSMSSGITRQVCRLRQRLRLTQKDLAMQLGISPRTLQDWEQGRRQPSGPGRALLLQWIDQHAQHGS